MYLFAYISFIPLFEKRKKKSFKKEFLKISIHSAEKKEKKILRDTKKSLKKKPVVFTLPFHISLEYHFLMNNRNFCAVIYCLLSFGNNFWDMIVGLIGWYWRFLEHISGLFFTVGS